MSRRQLVGLGVLVFILAAALMAPLGAPLGRDASVFALVGREWFAGMVPYRDLAVFKPPLMILLSGIAANAGDLVGLGVPTGVRLLSAFACAGVSVALAILLLGYQVRRSLAICFAIGITVVLGAPAFTIGQGGLSEPLGLAFALASWAIAAQRRSAFAAIAVGGLAAAALATSFSSVPFVVPPALLLLHRAWIAAAAARRQEALTTIIASLVGAALVTVPLLAALALDGALPALVDQLFTYNRAFMAVTCPPVGDVTQWPCLSNRLQLLAIYGAEAVPLLIIAAFALRHRPGRDLILPCSVLIAATVIQGPVLMRSGTYHYWWPILLALAVLGGIGAEWLARRSPAAIGTRNHRRAILIGSLAFSGFVSLSAVSDVLLSINRSPGQDRSGIVEAISSQDSTRRLLVWGDDTPLYFATGRQPSGPYPHAFSVELTGYANAERVRRVCIAAIRQQPLVVVDVAHAPDLSGTQPLAAGLSADWYRPLGELLHSDWQMLGQWADLTLWAPRPGAHPTEADCA